MTTLTYKSGVRQSNRDGEYLFIGSGTGKDVVRSIGFNDIERSRLRELSIKEILNEIEMEVQDGKQ